MMPTDSLVTGCAAPANAGARANEFVLARLAWLGELEASLTGSRKALQALDLAGIEQRTREQVDLIREFDALRRRQTGDDGAPGFAVGAPELEKELRRSGTRILEALRLQAALLARARCKLRVLANMLAGPSIDYGRLLAKGGAPSAWNRR